MQPGKVFLVGAGPGDPGLITVRGLELLGQADVVLHDALAHPALLGACPEAELYDVGKRYGETTRSQDEINAQLIALARAGKRVVRLKGGDPFLFARGAEEALALARAGIPFEVVPAVSSPVATSAYAGISLTHRELSSSVTFITGSDRAGKEWSPEAWRKLATATDTICVLMGMRRIEEITLALIDGGRDPLTPCAVIQWGAHPRQRVVTSTLGNIAATVRSAGLANPAVIVVGEVVGLRRELRWYDAQPLSGKRVLVPRPAQQAESTARAIRARGAEPVVFPVIEIVDPPEPERLSAALGQLASYDWVLFTSANGVERVFLALRRLGRDARAFAGARLGVIGPKTALLLERHGIRADVVADEYVGEGLARTVLASGPPRRVLLARALEAREALPEALRAAGVEVDVVAAYETRRAPPERARELVELFEKGSIDIVLFTASSTVRAVFELLSGRASELLQRVVVASIGPVTTKSLSEHGRAPDVTAETYTVTGLLDELERALSAVRGRQPIADR